MKTFFIIISLLFLCSCNKRAESEIKEREELNSRIDILNSELKAQQTSIDELKTQLKYFKEDLKNVQPKKTLNQLFLDVRNSVYIIRTINTNDETSLGSAFCITEDGIAISNHHVFEKAYESYAYNNNGNEFLISEIIEDNDSLDYIIFRLGPLSKPLPHLPISFNFSKIGEKVFTVGNPKGLEQTLSDGIISGYRKDNLIQTTTEITNGSSGGPLLNSEGEVIGITTSGFGEANLNFAVNISALHLNKYLRSSKVMTDTLITDVELIQKMSDYYNNLQKERLKILENYYNDTLKRFHGLFSIEKKVAIQDHKKYLSTYKIVEAKIIQSSLEIFRSNNEATLQYKLDFKIIKRKENIPRNFTLLGVAVINSEGKISSLYENILREHKN